MELMIPFKIGEKLYKAYIYYINSNSHNYIIRNIDIIELYPGCYSVLKIK